MNPANSNAVIPVNTGTTSNQLEVQIAEYNKMLLARNNVEAATSANNPLVQDYDTQLKGLRESVIRAINAQVEATRRAVANMEAEKGKVSANLAQGPQQAKALLSVERQQKVKESLYLFLLQKREENELSQAFTAYNTRIVNKPGAAGVPTTPNRRNILAMALLIGLAIPFGFTYVRETLNTKVRGRKDIEDLTPPFLGEIPLYGEHSKKKKAKEIEETPDRSVVVKAGKRDVINEAFRVLRTNLEFMKLNKDEADVVAITSFNPGSLKISGYW